MSFLTAVIAIADDGSIGLAGKLPWDNISEDMRHFKKLTKDHAVIMGRKTYDSIGKPLPNRRNIVVSGPYQPFNQNPPPGVEVAHHPLAAVRMAWESDPNPMVIGGGQIYSALWELCTFLFVTEVHQIFPGVGYDIFRFDPSYWRQVSRRKGETADIEFVEYTRPSSIVIPKPTCTGQLVHSEFDLCPVHDRKR